MALKTANKEKTTLKCYLLGSSAFFVLFTCAQLCGQQTSIEPVEALLEDILVEQMAAWNDGDIDGFMKHSWNADELTFSSGGTTHRGWQATLDRYKRKYPTPEQMGKLTFDHIEVVRLGDAAALVLGNWRLTRQDDTPGGNFSLVFRRIEEKWVIVHDHTSVLEPATADPSP